MIKYTLNRLNQELQICKLFVSFLPDYPAIFGLNIYISYTILLLYEV
jgi:hypothetical protein